MKKGFSIIELLIACAILTSALIGAYLASYQFPKTMQNVYAELDAVHAASETVDGAEIEALQHFASVQGDAFLEGAKIITSIASWSTADGAPHSYAFQSLITDPGGASNHPCQPFLSGDWTHPHILASYQLSSGALLPTSSPKSLYPVSALAVQGNTLIVGVSTTTHAADPTVFFFDVSEESAEPAYAGSLDTAPASRIGVTAIAAANGYAYLANGFSAVSTTTCTVNPVNCAQLQVVNLVTFARNGFLQIATTSPAHALTASGATAPAKAIAYQNGYAYLGLAKTASGQEVQIIDVHNPQQPVSVGGAQIGRSVNAIVADATSAYVATDDNSTNGKALIAFDMRDPSYIAERASFRFPGAGFLHALALSGTHVFTGRTYAAGTSEEFSILDAGASTTLTRIGGSDIGTSTFHQGAYALLLRDFIAFVLTENQLQLWNVTDPSKPILFASIRLPHGTATALACRENVLYVGSVDTDGSGYITTVTSS